MQIPHFQRHQRPEAPCCLESGTAPGTSARPPSTKSTSLVHRCHETNVQLAPRHSMAPTSNAQSDCRCHIWKGLHSATSEGLASANSCKPGCLRHLLWLQTQHCQSPTCPRQRSQLSFQLLACDLWTCRSAKSAWQVWSHPSKKVFCKWTMSLSIIIPTYPNTVGFWPIN